MPFCTCCGNEVNEKAVACPKCGVPPKLEKKHCYHCGEALANPNQVLCVKCGTPIAQNNAGGGQTDPIPKQLSSGSSLQEPWSGGVMFLFVLLSLAIPLFGWICGGLNMDKRKHSDGRRGQAIGLIIMAFAGAWFWFVASLN